MLRKYPSFMYAVYIVLVAGFSILVGHEIADRLTAPIAANATHVSRQDTWCKDSGDSAFLDTLEGRPRELMREVFIRKQRCLPMSTD